MCVCIYICICIHVYLYIYIRIYVYIGIYNMHIYMYIYIDLLSPPRYFLGRGSWGRATLRLARHCVANGCPSRRHARDVRRHDWVRSESVARARSLLQCHFRGGEAMISTCILVVLFLLCSCVCDLFLLLIVLLRMRMLRIRIRRILKLQQNLPHGLVRCLHATLEEVTCFLFFSFLFYQFFCSYY